MNFAPAFQHCDTIPKKGKIIIFNNNEELIATSPLQNRAFSDKDTLIDLTKITSISAPLFYIGTLEGEKIYCKALSKEESLEGKWALQPFSPIYPTLTSELQLPISRAKQILSWNRTHRFCGVCGALTDSVTHESYKECPNCGEIYFPRLSPAIIVRITRGDKILLAHNCGFPEGLYSNIAGFTEAGESLEDTVRREVSEEVGLEVENITFFGSQPWPMPHSLMVGFTAESPKGTPSPDNKEITDARWFTQENLPLLPAHGTIARKMIDAFFLGK